MQIAVKNIEPNPFRHIGRYPIRKDKVAALRESLRATGFWGNVVARPAKGGKAEIAYGHHRLVALREEYGPNHKVDLIVRDLPDETMLQMMARENMEEWGTNAAVEHETVRAVVEAYAEGRIKLPSVPSNIPRAQIRYAPSFVPGGEPHQPAGGAPYTAQSLATFIGWLEPGGAPRGKVLAALAALQFVEEGLLKESDFAGLTTMQAQAVVEEARKARNRREAAARVHRLQAEQAEREAKLAEERRAEAERERRRQQAEAAAAKDAEARRIAAAQVKRFDRERADAQEERNRALERQRKEQQKARAMSEEGRKKATAVGSAVSSSLKSGEIGYKQASSVATKAEGKRPTGPPPDIEDYARRFASELVTILDPDRDPKVKRLAPLLEFREYLSEFMSGDLARTFQVVANRALDYSRQFSVPNARGTQKALPPGKRS